MLVSIVYETKKIKTKEGKEFNKNQFYAQLDNGVLIHIQPLSFKDQDGKWHSNEKELLVVATKLG